MAYAVEHSDSQSPLTLTCQLSEAEKRGFLKTEYADRTREKRKFELKNTFAVHGIALSFVNKHLHLNTKKPPNPNPKTSPLDVQLLKLVKKC